MSAGQNSSRCLVEINIHAITSPGTWLSQHDDVYVSVQLFNQVRRTRPVKAVFPLRFHDILKFDKVFLSLSNTSEFSDFLQNVGLRVELLQVVPDYKEGQVLAWYESTANNFLYPFPTHSMSYATSDREVILERSLAFPGISPRMEFSTKTIIQKTTTPQIEHFSKEDCLSTSMADQYSKCTSNLRYRSPRPSRRSSSTVRFEYPTEIPAKFSQMISEQCHCITGSLRPITNSYIRPTVSSMCRSRSISSLPQLHHNDKKMGMDDSDIDLELLQHGLTSGRNLGPSNIQSSFKKINDYGENDYRLDMDKRHSRSMHYSKSLDHQQAPVCECVSGYPRPVTSSYIRPTCASMSRSRSLSPSPIQQYRYRDESYSDDDVISTTYMDRPPFVVRKVAHNIISRDPSPLRCRLVSTDAHTHPTSVGMNSSYGAEFNYNNYMDRSKSLTNSYIYHTSNLRNKAKHSDGFYSEKLQCTKHGNKIEAYRLDKKSYGSPRSLSPSRFGFGSTNYHHECHRTPGTKPYKDGVSDWATRIKRKHDKQDRLSCHKSYEQQSTFAY